MTDQVANFQVSPVPPRLHSSAFAGMSKSMGERVKSIEDSLWDLAQYAAQVAEVANGARRGKIDGGGEVTLDANDTTTTITNDLISVESNIMLTPTSANAAADVGSATGVYVSAVGTGTATITHPNTAATDKTFFYAVIG